MSNTYLTPDIILRKALQVLHAKLNFIGSINREYDDQFAKTGAKIGESLRIRLPEKFGVTTGRVMNVQDSTEQYTTLTVATQKHVAMNFTSRDLTMSIDDFAERKIIPAMSVLASNIEEDVLSGCLYELYNCVGTPGSPPASLKTFNLAKAKLNQYLAPRDASRTALLDSIGAAELVDALKGLFQDSTEVSKQYLEGIMGRAAGFKFAENDLLPTLTVGSRTGSVTINGAAPSGSTISIKSLGGATQTVKKGEVITIAGYYAVHPETKTPYSHLQQFVVTADKTASGSAITDLPISPAIVTTGAYQNVYGAPGTDAAITFLGTASTGYKQHVCFHKNAFAFVSADLELYPNQMMCERKVMDNISMRIWRQGDILNDMAPTRIDVLYGYKCIRPELAVRVWGQ